MTPSPLDNPFAININFDSLAEACGFPAGFRDPAFFEGFDRIVSLADKYGFKLTLFIIGRDLENSENFSRVRDWADAGHEIGNHSWSHSMSLGALPRPQIVSEVQRAHELISECAGREPRGFISPAWSTSGALISVLSDLGYKYDTSLFPSFFLYPMLMKMAINHFNQPKRILEILNRRDYSVPWRCPQRPVFIDGDFNFYDKPGNDRLLSLPLPNDLRFRPPLWHTLGFIFGWEYTQKRIKALVNNYPAFYYLIHPADFLGRRDLSENYSHALERMDVPLLEKMERLEQVFECMASSGRPSITMDGLADRVNDSLVCCSGLE